MNLSLNLLPHLRPRALAPCLLALALLGPAPAARAVALVTCAGKTATIVGTPGRDRLIGTSGPDVIAGLGGNDLIDGRGGNDVLCGGPGGDTIKGGPGDDRLVSGLPAANNGDHFGPADELEGGRGDDKLVAAGARPRKNAVVLSYAASPRKVQVDLSTRSARGWGSDTISAKTWVHVVGSRFDDTLSGTGGADWLDGRAGNDTIHGKAGADRLEDGAGDDTLFGGPGNDDLSIAFGHDTVHGNAGNDSIFAFDRRADRIYGDSGNDNIDAPVALTADQEISGGAGRDRAYLSWRVLSSGKPVFTRVTTDLVAETFTFTDQAVSFPFSGFERIDLDGQGTWTAIGTDGDDYYATGWNTRLFATMGAGNDRVWGSTKRDTVDGGPGNDRAKTYGGNDTCISVESLPNNDCEQVS